MTQTTPVHSVRRCRCALLPQTEDGRHCSAVPTCVWTDMGGAGWQNKSSCLERRHAEITSGAAKCCGDVRPLIVV